MSNSSEHSAQMFPGVIPPPLGVTPNLNFTQSQTNIATHVLCLVVTTLFIAARLWTKFFVMRRIDADDYASIAAWVGGSVYWSIGLRAGPLGLGIHMWNVSPESALEFFELGYVTEVLNGPVIFVTKLAILLMFIRIFEIKRNFVRFVKALIIMLGLYYTAITITKINICRPIAKFWNPLLPGTCLNSNAIFISDCIISIITDCTILGAPLPIIWKLQMSFPNKVKSSVAIVAGGLACLASILRLQSAYNTLHDIDQSYVFLPILLWSSCEMSIGIICGCIPVLPTLFRHFREPQTSTHSSQTQYSVKKHRRDKYNMTATLPLQSIPSKASSREAITQEEDFR